MGTKHVVYIVYLLSYFEEKGRKRYVLKIQLCVKPKKFIVNHLFSNPRIFHDLCQ